MKASPDQRFADKILFTDEGPMRTGCWSWQGARIPRGYGQFWNGEKVVRAHRWAYERFVAPIPEGLVLDHLCRNAWCVNPSHLETVTQAENVYRGDAPSSRNAGALRCIRGHEFDYVTPSTGGRQCRQCRKLRRSEKKGLTQ